MSEEGTERGISQDSKALFELLYLTREWLNKHHYYPMDAKFALQWVYALIERVSDDRWNSILAAMEEEQQTLSHRVEALEEVVEGLLGEQEQVLSHPLATRIEERLLHHTGPDGAWQPQSSGGVTGNF